MLALHVVHGDHPLQKPAMRSSVHQDATVPIAYTGNFQLQSPCGNRMRRAPAITASTVATNSSCPISTPTLKQQQRHRNRVGRQSDLAERAGEPEAVQQAEHECHDPRLPVRQPGSTGARVHDLAGQEHDAQRDAGLDRRRRHVHPPERRRRQREAVRRRERSDRPEQTRARRGPGSPAPARTADGRCRAGCARRQAQDRSAPPPSDRALRRSRTRAMPASRAGSGSCRPVVSSRTSTSVRVVCSPRSGSTCRRARHRAARASAGRRRCWQRTRVAGSIVVVPDGKIDIQREPLVLAQAGHLPQHVVSFGIELAQLQVGRACFVRQRGRTASRPAARSTEAPQGRGSDPPHCRVPTGQRGSPPFAVGRSTVTS